MRVTLPLSGGHHVDRSTEVNNQQLINWEVQAERSGGVSKLSIQPSAGLTLLGTSFEGPRRSHSVIFQNKSYWVSGRQLLSIDAGDNITFIGAIPTTTSWCVLAAGRDYLMLVDGQDGYLWDGTTYTSPVPDADFPANPTWVVYTDGVFYVTVASTDRVYASDFSTGSENPINWAALDYVVAEADPDDVVAMARTFEYVYFIGEQTTQIYYKSGNADFPLDLASNGVMEFGTEAPASVDTAQGDIFMLSRATDGGLDIINISGFQAKSIAEPDMRNELERYGDISDAEGFAYTQGQHTYYELTLPSVPITYVYTAQTGEWHRRKSDGIGRHRVRGHGFFNGRHLVGDYETGDLFYLDPTNYTENDDTVIRTRVTALVNKDGKQLECNEFEVHFKRGVGLSTGQGSDPQAMLRYSIDGGETWSNTIRRSIGAIGDTTRRAVWDRLGQGASFMFEISVSDPVEAVIIATYADIVELQS